MSSFYMLHTYMINKRIMSLGKNIVVSFFIQMLSVDSFSYEISISNAFVCFFLVLAVLMSINLRS